MTTKSLAAILAACLFATGALGQATTGTSSGGGGSSPGGSANQVQYNAAGSFGGFTLSGDCTLVVGTGVITCSAVGSQTPGPGLFTTVGASGQITSTVATGTAPLVVASTTNVANLNASSLNGATFAAPGAIGGTTPSAGVFTTVTASGGTSTLSGLKTGALSNSNTGHGFFSDTAPTVSTQFTSSGTATVVQNGSPAIVMTLPGTGTIQAGALALGTSAANGWVCSAQDRTTPAAVITEATTATTGVTNFNFSGGTNADVIQFSCWGY